MIKKSTPLSEVKELGAPCRKCGHCCQYGSGFLAEGDAENISRLLSITEEDLKKKYLEELEKFNTKRLRPKLIRKNGKPYGRCVFYSDEVGCKIHDVKPLQCKINNCSEHGEELALWFNLNYFVNSKDPESVRQYAAYIKSGGKVLAGGELKDIITDAEELKKILSFEVLK